MLNLHFHTRWNNEQHCKRPRCHMCVHVCTRMSLAGSAALKPRAGKMIPVFTPGLDGFSDRGASAITTLICSPLPTGCWRLPVVSQKPLQFAGPYQGSLLRECFMLDSFRVTAGQTGPRSWETSRDFTEEFCLCGFFNGTRNTIFCLHCRKTAVWFHNKLRISN